MGRFRKAAWGLVSVAWLLAGCASGPPPNILIIVIDTLRADRLDFYNTHLALTPFLKSLAEHGAVFWNAYAQCSWTSPSMASLWTARYQSQHQITGFDSVLSNEEITLPKILKGRGYVTGGFVANTLLSAQLGFGQGFDRYETLSDGKEAPGMWAKTPAEKVNAAALAWLRGLRQSGQGTHPLLLYLHYMEPHFPYFPPREETERVLSRRPNRAEEERAFGDLLLGNTGRWRHPDALTLTVIKDLYSAEVMSIDGKLRDLFAELDAQGFLQNAVVVITADHGEELLDHGLIGHGETLYNEVLHVPLLFLLPGQQRRVDVTRVVSLVDVAPTVLDLAGISPPASFEGRSRRNAMRWPAWGAGVLARLEGVFGAEADGARAYSELLKRTDRPVKLPSKHTHSLVRGSEKLIVDSDGALEGYDLSTDPAETNRKGLSVSDEQSLKRALDAMIQRTVRPVSPARTVPLDEQTKERMRALGYANSP